METHQIRYFLAVAETLNFTRAAEDCHVAQPSLSRAIKKLEEELGGELLRRERGKTHLTELGRTIQPFLRQAYDAAVAAKAQAASYGSAEYAPLRLGLSLTVDLDIIGPMLAELDRAYRGLELHLMHEPASSILEALKSGAIEIAIMADAPSEWERFDRWTLFEEAFVVVMPPDHPLAGRDSVTVSDLARQTVIARPYCESSQAVHDLLHDRGVSVPYRHAAANEDDARVLAGHGLGVALLPESAARTGQRKSISDVGVTRTVRAYGVAGRKRSAAASTLLMLLRAADWSQPGAAEA